MGTGINGGFGNTKGRSILSLFSNITNKKGIHVFCKNNYTRESLIHELEGQTKISNEIAERIKKGDIFINILGDHLFNEYLNAKSETVAVTVNKQIYLRASSASIVSDLVHEGNHALEFFSNINPNNIRTWPGEIRAYKAEREFQIKTNRPVDFINENDLLVHVWKNYEREAKK